MSVRPRNTDHAGDLAHATRKGGVARLGESHSDRAIDGDHGAARELD
jgi:hypothetical protein